MVAALLHACFMRYRLAYRLTAFYMCLVLFSMYSQRFAARVRNGSGSDPSLAVHRTIEARRNLSGLPSESRSSFGDLGLCDCDPSESRSH